MDDASRLDSTLSDAHEAGVRDVLRVAWPLVISSLSWTIMNFIDRLMLLQHSADAVAAALPAGITFWAVICLPFGIASYVNTFVAQYYGAQRLKRIGPVVWQGVWLGVLVWPIAVLTAPWVCRAFDLFGHDGNIVPLEATYYSINAWAAGPLVAASALSSYFTGRGKVRVVMTVDSLAAAVNVGLDYLWIYGHGGFPELGIAGAAWATVAAISLKCLIYLVLFLSPRAAQTCDTRASCRFDRALYLRLLRYGGPNGLQMFIEILGFTVFVLLLGRLGPLELTASSLALNVNNLAFMPAWGVALATSTIVGQYLGRNRDDLAVRGTWSAMKIAGTYMLCISSVYVFVPDSVMLLHRLADHEDKTPELRQTVIVLLRFAGTFGLLDAMSLVFSGALKGAGDTRFILATNLVMATLPVIATWVGIDYFGLGLYWAWVMLTVWVFGLGVIFFLRFQQGRWRHMRVIEDTVDEA